MPRTQAVDSQAAAEEIALLMSAAFDLGRTAQQEGCTERFDKCAYVEVQGNTLTVGHLNVRDVTIEIHRGGSEDPLAFTRAIQMALTEQLGGGL